MSIMPKADYSQGINRQWLRETRYDFFFPEFANLSEQEIREVEVYATEIEAQNNTVFGFQGRYDEMRTKQNMICGELRPTDGNLAHWTLGRSFGSRPTLNQSFIECVPSKRTYAVQNEDVMVVQVANLIHAARPMPAIADPSTINMA